MCYFWCFTGVPEQPYLLTVICAFFTVNDYSEFGITRSLYFYTAETFLFLAISILLGFVDKEYWVDDKS